MKNLIIKKAYYYDPKQGYEKGTDVTDELNSELKENQLIYNEKYNRIFPDKFKSVKKKLRVELVYGRKEKIKIYNEDDRIDLPKDLGIKGFGVNFYFASLLITVVGGIIVLLIWFYLSPNLPQSNNNGLLEDSDPDLITSGVVEKDNKNNNDEQLEVDYSELGLFEEITQRIKNTSIPILLGEPDNSFRWVNNGYDYLIDSTGSVVFVKEWITIDMADVPERMFSEELKISREALLGRGFIVNEENSSTDKSEKGFFRYYDYIEAFEKEDELCIVKVSPEGSSHKCEGDFEFCTYLEVICGTNLESARKEQQPFLDALNLQNKNSVTRVGKVDEPFYQIAVNFRRTGYLAILKKENDDYRLLYKGQENPTCEIIEKEKIPLSIIHVYEGEKCWTEEGEFRKINY